MPEMVLTVLNGSGRHIVLKFVTFVKAGREKSKICNLTSKIH